MKFIRSFKMLALLAIASVPLVSQAQVPGFFQRIQLGYSFLSENATYRRVYPLENKVMPRIDESFRDTTILLDIKPESAYGLFLGSYIPVARLGKASTLSFSVEVSLDMIEWGTETQATTPDVLLPEVTGSTTRIGVPLGLDMKFGCDANPDKSYRWCGGFGLGAIPTSASTEVNGESNSEKAIRPYIRGEIGVLAGLCFKVRGMYSFGRIPYINIDNSKPNSSGNIYENSLSLTGNSTFSVSLIIMPFAPTWPESRWWH